MLLEDKLRKIEDLVGRLIEEIDRLRNATAPLHEKPSAARGKSRETGPLRDENDQLRQRVAKLETEIARATQKEREIRERLRVVIHKIDALEAMPEDE